MRINHENKTMDMEARDINYILPAYVRSYLFYNKNQMPEKIIFPMFASVNVLGADRTVHPIPIEWVPPLDEVAIEIAKDGESVAEVTPAQEAALDEKDEQIKTLKEEVKRLTEGGPEEPLTPTPEDLLRQVQEEALPGEGEEETVQQIEDEAADKKLEIETAEPPAESPAKSAFKIDPDPAHQPPAGRQPGQPPGGDIGPGQGLSDMHARDRKDQIKTARDLKEEPEIDESVEVPFEKEVKRDDQGRPIVEDKPDAPSGQ